MGRQLVSNGRWKQGVAQPGQPSYGAVLLLPFCATPRDQKGSVLDLFVVISDFRQMPIRPGDGAGCALYARVVGGLGRV